MVWSVVVSPSFLVFFSVSLMGTLLVLVSSGLLGMWLCLELAFFGFIPILNGKGSFENEAASKYFVVQSVGSGILLVSFMMISSYNSLVVSNMLSVLVNALMLIGFLIKLGVFPMHFWFPSVMSSSSWFSCFWLSVMQKIGPFWGVSGLGMGGVLVKVFMVLAIVTSLVGAVGGLAQVQFRPLLAYSSLGQMGWMTSLLFLNLEVFIYYMVLYSLLLTGLLMGLFSVSSQSVTSSPGWSDVKGVIFWVFSGSYFMSLAGVPFMAGFVLKFAGVLVLINQFPFYLAVLMFTSMVSLYFYLSMMISSMVCVGSMTYSSFLGHLLGNNVSLFIIVLCSLNLFGGLPLFLMCGMIMG